MIPLAILAGLFLLGTCVGGLVNLATYTLAFHARPLSPWSRPADQAPPRRWTDRIPVFGWLGLRRESSIHGKGFWVRPLVVEVLTGLGFAALYWWEISQLAHFDGLPNNLPEGFAVGLHLRYAAHLMLISLMLVATLIDLDEKLIPDTITIPGTLFALVVVAVFPDCLLPVVYPTEDGLRVAPLLLTAAPAWPAVLNGSPQRVSLAIALGCWWLWCGGLLDLRWYRRRGWLRAISVCFAGLRRRHNLQNLGMGVAGTVGIVAAWRLASPLSWAALLTALVGMLTGGLLVWLVRVVGSAALKQEAMGFGDVTLMAMIGALLGWQNCILIFFIAPLPGLVAGVANLVVHRDHEIPYGPFLCLGALTVIVYWAPLWDWAREPFEAGWLVPAVMALVMVLMGVLLGGWRMIRVAIGGVLGHGDSPD